MTRTKSMIYKETPEATELYMFATNTAELWHRMIQPAIANLQKKYNKGIYDHDKAVDLLYYTMNEASRMYNKLFGYSFSVQDRFTASVDLENYLYQDYIEA